MPHLPNKEVGQAGVAVDKTVSAHTFFWKGGDGVRPLFTGTGKPPIIVEVPDGVGQHTHGSVKAEFVHNLF